MNRKPWTGLESLEARQFLSVSLSNGLSSGDANAFVAVIGRGGSSTTVELAGIDTVYAYRAYLEVSGQVYDLSSLGNEPVQEGDAAVATATISPTGGGTINVEIESRVPAGSQSLVTRYGLSASGGASLLNAKLFQYLDTDVPPSAGDDVLKVTGSIAGGDLVLATIDPVTYVQESQTIGLSLLNATVTGFAADQYSDLRTSITTGGFNPGLAGSIDTSSLTPGNFPGIGAGYGPRDIGTAIQYTINHASSAVVRTAVGPSNVAVDLADLRVTQVSSEAAVITGQPLGVTWTVLNDSQTAAAGTWTDAVYLSIDDRYDSSDILLGTATHTGGLTGNAFYHQRVELPTTGVPSGNYRVLVRADSGGAVNEGRLESNNTTAGPDTIQAGVPTLTLGQASNQSIPAGQTRYFAVQVGDNVEHLLLELDDTDNQGVNEVFMRYGQPPTLDDYAQRSTMQGADQQVSVAAPAAGTWYIMVRSAQSSGAAGMTLTATAAGLDLLDVDPGRISDDAPIILNLKGLGFDSSTQVRLVSQTGQLYTPSDTDLLSLRQMTARFNTGTLPVGTYDVRVVEGSRTVQLDDAVVVVGSGSADFRVNLITPSYMGYHELATIVLEYSNQGTAAMRAPLVFVTAEQDGRRAPLLTMDRSRLSYGFWTSAKPEGFENYVQVLASGEVPGWLMPGETGRVEIYYAGWQQPWNTWQYPPFQWSAAAIPADATAAIDWNSIAGDIRPAGLADDAWNAVLGNLLNGVGTTWGQYVTMLGENANHLAQLDESYTNARDLFGLEFYQANGGNPVRSLGAAVDLTLITPGIDLGFSRMYPQMITERYRLGAMGRGWMHNWETSLSVRTDGTVDVNAPDHARVFQPDARGGYLSAPGDAASLTKLADNAGYSLREADGRVMRFTAAGALSYVEDAHGNRVTMTYTSGRLTKLTHSAGPTLTLAYNAQGRVSSVTDSLSRVTSFAYDTAGEHLLSATHADGTITRYAYQTGGNVAQRHALTSTTLPDGTVSLFSYDSLGRLTGMKQQAQATGLTFAYGPAAQVTATDPSGQTITYMMNAQGQIGAGIDGLGRAFQLDTNEALQIVAATDPGGAQSLLTYDAAGNPTRLTDPLGNDVNMTFDAGFGGISSLTDPLGNTTWFTYTAKGDLAQVTDALGNRERFTYDQRGILQQSINRRGQTADYVTDAQGQVTRRTVQGETTVTYTYDTRGRLTSMTDASGTTTYTYTNADLIDRVTYPGGLWLDFDYDAAGRRTRMTDQTGHQTNYAYDALGQMSRVTDQNGTLIVEYQYDAGGRISRRNLGNGAYSTTTYNAAGQVAVVTNYGAGNVQVSRFAYTYDSHGALTGMSTPEGAWTYTYDVLGQLIRAVFASTNTSVAPNQDLRYEYDGAGNRVRTVLNGTTADYEVNALNGYTSAGNATFTYDADGNMATRTDSTGTWNYTYDAMNRLIGVTHGGDTWSYTYNGMGQRVAVTKNGLTTRYLIDPAGLGNVVGQYANGSLVARFDWGLDLAARSGGSYYQYDGVGNTTELLAGNGAVQNVYRYLPFGQTLRRSEQVANDFEYLGGAGVTTESNGLMFMRARSYDPVLGRFTQQDPIGLAGGSINLYTYGENNPLTVTDPSGLQSTYHKMIYMALLKKFPHAKTQLMNIMRAVPNTGNFEAFAAMNGVDIAALRQVYLTKFAGAGARFVGTAAATTTTTAVTSTAATTTTTTAAAGATATTAAGTGGFLAWPGAMACAAAAATAVLVWQGGSYLASGAGSLTGSDTLSDIGSAMDAALSPDGWQVAYDYYRDWLFGSPSQTVGSYDPNQKLGPAGVGTQHYIAPGATLPYRIDFENDDQATAPAKIVRITDPLDSDLDWNTFELTEVGWGDIVIPVPEGSRQFETTQSMSYNGVTFNVHVRAGIDLSTGQISAIFESLDPDTGLPMGAATGFLPPEDGTGRGQGHLNYRVRAKSGLGTGTQIRNIATIVFDFNDPITTDQIDVHDPSQGVDPNKQALNTIDAAAPASQVGSLPASVYTPTFPVSWSGNDSGSGVAAYDVYVSADGGAWSRWLNHTTQTQANYTGAVGHRYAFYSVAVDGVGHRETAPASADAQVNVLETPPFTEKPFGGKVVASYTDAQGNLIKVSLSGPGSGIAQVPVDGVTPPTIVLTGTTEKSSLIFKTSKATTVAAIDVTGSLKAISGKLVNVKGNIDISGTVLTVTLGNLQGPGVVTVGGSETSLPASFTFASVDDFSLQSGLPIKSLKANAWIDDDGTQDQIAAPWLTSATIKGNLEADLRLSSATAKMGLNKLTVAGWLRDAQVRAQSNIGTISVAGMKQADVLLGMQANLSTLPTSATPFLVRDKSIKSLAITGKVNQGGMSFLDSTVAGWTIGKVTLRTVEDGNSGQALGVAAHSVASLSAIVDGTTRKGSKLDTPDEGFTLGDFQLRLV